jgi:hypothetical protein
MSIAMDGMAPAGRLRGLKWVAGGILVVGGVVGLVLNQSAAESRVRALREDPALYAAVDSGTAQVPQAVIAPAQQAGGRVILSMRQVENTPPPDPFAPVPIPRESTQPLVITQDEQPLVKPSLEPARPTPAPAAAPELAEGAPKADQLSVTGIVQGDPPLAVVEFQGQSLFLKIGDKVADSWRLVEIRERSALFALGPRRVEVPIKGGSGE